MRWGDDGPCIDGGLSRNEYEARTKQEMDRVNKIAPYTKHSKTLKSRNGIAAVYLGLSDNINGKKVRGWSAFHASEIDDPENIATATAEDAKYWDIDEGEPFVVMPECVTGLHGDDGQCIKWPVKYQNIDIAFVRIHMFKNMLHHSQFSSVVVLICSESSKSEIARVKTLEICEQLSNLHKLTIWNIELSCWMCFHHSFHGCHDWVYEVSLHGFLNHASTYFLHNVNKIDQGQIKCLDNNFDSLYESFVDGIPRNNYNINLDLWQREGRTGLCLTTTEMIEWQWTHKLEPAIRKEFDDLRCKNELFKWNDREFRNKRLRTLAKNKHINLNRNPRCKWKYNLLTESMHCWFSYMKGLILSTIYNIVGYFEYKHYQSRKLIAYTSMFVCILFDDTCNILISINILI